jgi:hypothetical protein
MMAAYVLSDVLDTALKGAAHFRSLGPFYPALMAGSIGIAAVGALTRNERIHAALVSFAFAALGIGLTNALSSVALAR